MNCLVKKRVGERLAPYGHSAKRESARHVKKESRKKASHGSKDMTNISEPLQLIHTNLFVLVNVMSMSRKRGMP